MSSQDDHVVNVAFHAALSAYFKPLNLALKAESGSGKSYSTTQTLMLMPPEDILWIASQSPKVISHEHGTKKTNDGRNFDEIPEPQKPQRSDYPEGGYNEAWEVYKAEVKEYRELEANAYYEVDLRGKIIVFLEGFSQETFKMFKATMSHDNEENGYVDHKYVDDKGRVHKTRLVGAPALIFNSLDNEYLSEFATRCLTAAPSTTKDKILAAMKISNEKSSFPWLYEKETFNHRLIQEYVRRIRDTMKLGKIGIVNPFTELYRIFSKDQTRAMRDFNHYLELIAPFAMVMMFQRPIVIIAGKRYLIPSIKDVLEAKAALELIQQTTQTGTEQRIINFYFDVVAKHLTGSTAEVLTDEYNRTAKKSLTVRRVREYLNRLVEIEWVDEREGVYRNDKGYIDSRYKTYVPIKKCDEAAILQTAEDLKPVLENSFKEWLKTIAEIISPCHPIVVSRIDGTAYQITLNEVEHIVLGREGSAISAVVSTPITEPVNEKEVEIAAEKKTASSPQNSMTIRYQRIIPPKARPCDGLTHGHPCPLLAEFEMVDGKQVYCREHFDLTRKSCDGNGFILDEVQPEMPDFEDKIQPPCHEEAG